MKRIVFVAFIAISVIPNVLAQQSVARQWNEAILHAIRGDLARPTVHARNLHILSMVMYDSWAVLDPVAETYLLGKTVDGYPLPFSGFPMPANVKAAQEEAMSHAAYRVLTNLYQNSPSAASNQAYLDSLMTSLGHTTLFTGIDYSTGDAAQLGNYIGLFSLGFAYDDGSNAANDYENRFYTPLNPPLAPHLPGNPDMLNPNYWQPLELLLFIDQAGNVFTTTPEFQGAEWGWVRPFSLDNSQLDQIVTDTVWNVWLDPGSPPWLLSDSSKSFNNDYYRWGFELVSKWGSHLDPADSVIWDISPATIGNIQSYPDYTDLGEMQNFYKEYDGGDAGVGHATNPVTGLPYNPNPAFRGDYARVLAEFWADGPDSETPPGHWFVLLNEVADDTLFEKRWNGVGPVMDDLEWDVKSYFALGGAMHDVAIAAWSVKRWYDYPRPISTLRWMGDRGQCTDSTQLSYHPDGLNLDSGYIEVVFPGDSLQGDSLQNIGKIKLRTWVGTDTLSSPDTTVYGVDWILAENWWPYQRPTFVTPPFAGYVSGHSTYSRAAAEVLNLITGDPFFPGGMHEFIAEEDSFLVFEDGPSQDVVLQWGTYFDAADQCSLSRIWGGIHPPQDDIPGREMGKVIGPQAYYLAESYFNGIVTETENTTISHQAFDPYPNPVVVNSPVRFPHSFAALQPSVRLFDTKGKEVAVELSGNALLAPDLPGLYFIHIEQSGVRAIGRILVVD